MLSVGKTKIADGLDRKDTLRGLSEQQVNLKGSALPADPKNMKFEKFAKNIKK